MEVSGDSISREIRPVIHASKLGDDAQHAPAQVDAALPTQDEQEQRRFYMSRSLVTSPDTPVQATKKRRYSATLFIERDMKKHQKEPTITQGKSHLHTLPGESAAAPAPTEASRPPTGPEEMDVDAEVANEPRALKRPGKQSRIRKAEDKEGAVATAPLPQMHGDMDKVAAEMSAWTVTEIQRNLDELEERKVQSQTTSVRPGTRDALRFQPRVPARRYSERQPQQGGPATGPPGGDAMAVDTAHDDDGEEWVEVVYHRVPASVINGTVPQKDIGVIVFEDDEEKEYFYGATEEDSDADGFDDDDENGMFVTLSPALFAPDTPV